VVAAGPIESLGLPVRLPDVLAVWVTLIECHGYAFLNKKGGEAIAEEHQIERGLLSAS
jgi:hypothetical protein